MRDPRNSCSVGSRQQRGLWALPWEATPVGLLGVAHSPSGYLVCAQVEGKGVAKGRQWERNVVEKLCQLPAAQGHGHGHAQGGAHPLYQPSFRLLWSPFCPRVWLDAPGPVTLCDFPITLGPERTGCASEGTKFLTWPLKCWGFHG